MKILMINMIVLLFVCAPGILIAQPGECEGGIAGYVYMEDGITPLEGMEVYAVQAFGPSGSGTCTASDGFFSISLEAGNYYVSAGYWRLDVCGVDYHDYCPEVYNNNYVKFPLDIPEYADQVSVECSLCTYVDFQLGHFGSISGSVYEDDGVTPIGHTWISAVTLLQGYEQKAYTNADGSYLVSDLCPSSYFVIASGVSDVGNIAVREFWNDAYDWFDADLITVKSGQTTSGIDFVLKVYQQPDMRIIDARMVSPSELGIDVMVEFPIDAPVNAKRMLKFWGTINGKEVAETFDITELIGPGETKEIPFDYGSSQSIPRRAIDFDKSAVPRFTENICDTLYGRAYWEGGPKSEIEETEIKILLPVILLHGYTYTHISPFLHFLSPIAYQKLQESLRDNGYAKDEPGPFSYTTLWGPPNIMYEADILTPELLFVKMDGWVTNALTMTYADKVNLVGHSTGGLIARYYAGRSSKVHEVVCVGTPHLGLLAFYEFAFNKETKEEGERLLKIGNNGPYNLLLWFEPNFSTTSLCTLDDDGQMIDAPEPFDQPEYFPHKFNPVYNPDVEYYSIFADRNETPYRLCVKKKDNGWYEETEPRLDVKCRGDSYVPNFSAGAFRPTFPPIREGTHPTLCNQSTVMTRILNILTEKKEIHEDDITSFFYGGVVTFLGSASHSLSIGSEISEAEFNLSWPGSDLDFVLRDPESNVIDSAIAGIDPNIDFRSGDAYEQYVVHDPIPGEWTMEIVAMDVPQDGETYLAYANLLTNPLGFPDEDNDNVVDELDNCPLTDNPGQSDIDGDNVGDACDNCPTTFNPDQEDSNHDGIGDVCSAICGDINEDKLCNSTDALVVLSYDVGLPVPGGMQQKIDQGCADINHDEFSNSTDALMLLSYDVGLPVPFCVCECACPCPGAPTFKIAAVKGTKAVVGAEKYRPAVGDAVIVPVVIDMNQTSEKLGSFSGSMTWDSQVLRFISYSGGTTAGFDKPALNENEVGNGELVFANAHVDGAEGEVNIINVSFEVIGPEGAFSAIQVGFEATTAARTFNDLLAGMSVEAAKVAVVGLPTEFALEQNYPNPFNPTTAINYQIPMTKSQTHTTLKIYNILGQEVATLVDEVKGPGYCTVRWDASDMASGVYFYRLQAEDFTSTKRMILVR